MCVYMNKKVLKSMLKEKCKYFCPKKCYRDTPVILYCTPLKLGLTRDTILKRVVKIKETKTLSLCKKKKKSYSSHKATGFHLSSDPLPCIISLYCRLCKTLSIISVSLLSSSFRASVGLCPDCQCVISDVWPVSLLCHESHGNRELLRQPVHLQQ